jgi:hypothetical protein
MHLKHIWLMPPWVFDLEVVALGDWFGVKENL